MEKALFKRTSFNPFWVLPPRTPQIVFYHPRRVRKMRNYILHDVFVCLIFTLKPTRLPWLPAFWIWGLLFIVKIGGSSSVSPGASSHCRLRYMTRTCCTPRSMRISTCGCTCAQLDNLSLYVTAFPLYFSSFETRDLFFRPSLFDCGFDGGLLSTTSKANTAAAGRCASIISTASPLLPRLESI